MQLTQQTVAATGEDYAFDSEAMPCNAVPFLRRMLQILKEAETNSPNSLDRANNARFRANLWIVMSQTFPQAITIDLCDEFIWLRDNVI